MCKKLAGAAAGTAAWVTNVSNEKGEVLISVVTASEALPALKPMGDGLMKRSVGLVTFSYCYTYYTLGVATLVAPLSFWSYLMSGTSSK